MSGLDSVPDISWKNNPDIVRINAASEENHGENIMVALETDSIDIACEVPNADDGAELKFETSMDLRHEETPQQTEGTFLFSLKKQLMIDNVKNRLI